MKSQVKNIIFFGTSEFAVPTLKALIRAKYDIAAVITQPDKPMGRKQILTPPPVKLAAQKLGLKVLQPESLKIESFKNSLEIRNSKLEIDLGIVAAYGKIIPKWLIDFPQYGILNIHPSLLPKYRGPSPIQTALLNGEKETGVSIMVADEEVDHGPILENRRWKVGGEMYYKELEKELADMGAKLLVEILPKYLSGDLEPKEQDHAQATFTKILKREDGRIDWRRPAQEIFNQIRALNPEPGTWTAWPARRSLGEGGQGKVINIPTSQVGYPQMEAEKPGTVRKVDKDIVVATGKCYLVLKHIQLEGGKMMDVQSFVNGHPDFLNSKLE